MKSTAPVPTLGVCLLFAATVSGDLDIITMMDDVSSATAARAAHIEHDFSGGNGGVTFIACQSDACTNHQQASVIVAMPDPVQACLPERLHPVSRQYLDAFLLGHISRAQFLRGFPLPNSDYVSVEDCIIAAIDALIEAGLAAPAGR